MDGLRTRVLTSLRWAAAARLCSQLFTWAVTIYVIRILNPDDYGLMGIASVLVAFLMMMNELGLGAALVQSKDLEIHTQRQIFGLVLVVNSLATALVFAAAPLIAQFYEEARLTSIIRVLAGQFLIMSFLVVPRSQLERAIDLKRASIVDFIAAALSSVTTLLMALAGFAVWSLVWGSMVMVTMKAIGYNLVSPFRHSPTFAFAGVGKLFSFGGYVTLARSLWSFYSQADMMIAGKLLGKEALGVYYVAMHLATLPMQKISGIINQVSFPAYSRVQDDTQLVAHYFLKSVRLMSLAAFPVLWGISSVAPEIVRVLLEEKWSGTIVPLQLIALLTPIRMVNNLTASVYLGIGRADLSFKTAALLAVAMPIAFMVGCQWGVVGLCMAWISVFPIATAINMQLALPAVGLGMHSVGAQMSRAVAAGAGMYMAVYVVRTLIPSTVAAVVTLSILVATGAVAYALLTLVINRAALVELRELARG